MLCTGAATPGLPGEEEGSAQLLDPGTPLSQAWWGGRDPEVLTRHQMVTQPCLCLGPGLDMLQSRKFWAPLPRLATGLCPQPGVSERTHVPT